MKSNLKLGLSLMASVILNGCGTQDAAIQASEKIAGGMTAKSSPAPGATPAASATPTPTGVSCTDFSGVYSSGGFANLMIKQTGCDKVKVVQTCTGSFCNYAAIENFTVEVPLDGSLVTIGSVAYQASVDSSKLTLSKVTSQSRSLTRVITFADHPCDPNNPQKGLEIKIKDQQGPVTVTTCQPWSI